MRKFPEIRCAHQEAYEIRFSRLVWASISLLAGDQYCNSFQIFIFRYYAATFPENTHELRKLKPGLPNNIFSFSRSDDLLTLDFRAGLGWGGGRERQGRFSQAAKNNASSFSMSRKRSTCLVPVSMLLRTQIWDGFPRPCRSGRLFVSGYTDRFEVDACLGRATQTALWWTLIWVEWGGRGGTPRPNLQAASYISGLKDPKPISIRTSSGRRGCTLDFKRETRVHA